MNSESDLFAEGIRSAGRSSIRQRARSIIGIAGCRHQDLHMPVIALSAAVSACWTGVEVSMGVASGHGSR
jgi:hypothetical protein